MNRNNWVLSCLLHRDLGKECFGLEGAMDLKDRRIIAQLLWLFSFSFLFFVLFLNYTWLVLRPYSCPWTQESFMAEPWGLCVVPGRIPITIWKASILSTALSLQPLQRLIFDAQCRSLSVYIFMCLCIIKVLWLYVKNTKEKRLKKKSYKYSFSLLEDILSITFLIFLFNLFGSLFFSQYLSLFCVTFSMSYTMIYYVTLNKMEVLGTYHSRRALALHVWVTTINSTTKIK